MAEKQSDDPSSTQDDLCTDEYILGPIACALTDTNVDLSDLAFCLEVPFDEQTADSDTKRNKVVIIILMWASKNSEQRSKKKLLSCLKRLKNAEDFEKELKKYNSKPPDSEIPGLMIDLQQPPVTGPGRCSQVSVVPVSANDDLESASSVSEASHVSHPPPVVVLPPQQCVQQMLLAGVPIHNVESVSEVDHLSHPPPVDVSPAQRCVQQMLVSGAPKAIRHADIRTEPRSFVNVRVTRTVASLEERFTNLLCDVRRQLQHLPQADIEDIRLYLTSLSVSIQEDVSPCVFTTHQAALISCSTVTEMFQWLTIHGFWSFLNFYLLKNLVERYCNNEMKEKVTAFQDEIEKFKRETKLADFLPAWSGRCPHIPSSGFTPIILRVNQDWGGCTLADVARLEGFIESRFLINRFLLRFANGHPGSVWIMWLVPSHAVAFIRKRITEIANSKVLNEAWIIEGQTSVMKVSSITLPTHVETTGVGEISSPLIPVKSKSLLDQGNYEQLYSTSVKNPDFFWGMLANEFLHWDVPFNTVMDCKMETGDIKWFTNGKLNVSVNCVDRHASLHPDQVALIWEKDEPGEDEKVTYRELLQKVCQIANALKKRGVEKGDLVAIYMPICPLAVASMLACARIGAVHSVLFSRFALIKEVEDRDNTLKERLSGAKVIITANTSPLNGESLKLKESLDNVLGSVNVQHVLVFKRTADKVPMKMGRDEWLEEAMACEPIDCKPEPLDSEDELFVMFTSGSTGKANGVVHTQAGYLLYTAMTQKYYFDYKPGEVFACDADIGWITGHSYVVYGPLCNGATTVLFDSTAEYPKPSRYWEMVEKHSINHFYTTPHVVKTLKSHDKDIPRSFNMASLKIIASVGDCLHSETKEWFYQRFGQGKCPLIDTWWQTELGGIAISSDPRENGGKSMKPSFGVVPCLIDKEVELSGCKVQGYLHLAAPLPGMGRRLTGADGEKNFREYFKSIDGKSLFDTHDTAHRGKDGDYEIICRADDVIRYHGELLNLPKIEGAAKASHECIEEAYVVSCHKVLVQLRDKSDDTKREVVSNVQKSIEEITEIKGEYVEVECYYNDELSDHRTLSGKTKRFELALLAAAATLIV